MTVKNFPGINMLTLSRMRAAAAALLTLALIQPAFSHEGGDLEAVTSDGRVVVLHVDHTWDFLSPESGEPESSAVLTVTEIKEMQEACGLQLRLQNNLGHKVRSLAPRLSVYNAKNIVFDHKAVSFTSIKPGRKQYRSLQFNGIGCHEIKWIRVHDARHCTIGDAIDMFNAEEGQCLSYIYVEPSELINISKEPIL